MVVLLRPHSRASAVALKEGAFFSPSGTCAFLRTCSTTRCRCSSRSLSSSRPIGSMRVALRGAGRARTGRSKGCIDDSCGEALSIVDTKLHRINADGPAARSTGRRVPAASTAGLPTYRASRAAADTRSPTVGPRPRPGGASRSTRRGTNAQRCALSRGEDCPQERRTTRRPVTPHISRGCSKSDPTVRDDTARSPCRVTWPRRRPLTTDPHAPRRRADRIGGRAKASDTHLNCEWTRGDTPHPVSTHIHAPFHLTKSLVDAPYPLTHRPVGPHTSPRIHSQSTG